MTGSVTNLTTYSGSLIWRSLTDLPDGVGFIDFRITPSDNDPGQADTVTFFLDNVGAPLLTSITTPQVEVSGDIDFDYTVSDEEGDSVRVSAEYSLNSGGLWQAASSTIIELDSIGYEGTVIWHSVTDAQGIDAEAALLRITPQEVLTGIKGLPGATTPFHLDNNAPPALSITTLSIDTVISRVALGYLLTDAESDTLSITADYSLDGGQNWLPSAVGSTGRAIGPADYRGTVDWLSFANGLVGTTPNVQLRLLPRDNDAGAGDSLSGLTVIYHPGDYTGDLLISTDDLLQFAAAWNAQPQTIAFEIGPASGTVPDLTPQPDGILDFEDLVVFVQMWNWSFANNGFAKAVPTIAKRSSGVPSLRLVQVVPDNLWEWDGRTVIRLEGQVSGDLMMIDGLLRVDGSRVRLKQFAEGGALAARWKSVPLFVQASDDSSQTIIALAGLGIRDDVIDGDELPLLTFEVDLARSGTQTVTLDYTLWDREGQVLETGAITLAVENLLPTRYALHQNYPNPFNPVTTIRYELPRASKVELRIYNLLGREVIRLVDEDQIPGYHQAIWPGRDARGRSVSSGIYIARLVAPGYAKSIKMVLLK